MLRDFPVNLQRSGEAIIPPRPSATPVSPASFYHQRYVSHSSKLLHYCSLNLRVRKLQECNQTMTLFYQAITVRYSLVQAVPVTKSFM